ncbi:hypothetical protein C2E19_13500 [Pseudomonas sp. DTU12.3]|nr:hypothetical protein C2E19_13500 [Pseudomonas sp. DTU12.3]
MGASLLAKAVGQSMERVTVTPPSRAGSLPQGNSSVIESGFRLTKDNVAPIVRRFESPIG